MDAYAGALAASRGSITIVARVNHPALDMIQSAARNVIHSLSLSLSFATSLTAWAAQCASKVAAVAMAES